MTDNQENEIIEEVETVEPAEVEQEETAIEQDPFKEAEEKGYKKAQADMQRALDKKIAKEYVVAKEIIALLSK